MNIERIEFTSGGTTCSATVFTTGAHEDAPAVIMCTGFSGTQDTPSIEAAALAFAEAGYVAVTFDYRNFGASAGQPRQLIDIAGQIADIAAVIARVRELPSVDPDAITLWGTSLGGAHVITAAAADARIAAVVAQIPFNGFPRKVEGRSRKSTLALLWAMVRDQLHGWLGREPYYIAAVGGSGELAVMTGPEVTATIAALESPTWENRVAPRALLQMMRYQPERSARRLGMPVLVCIGERDKETLAVDSARLGDNAPHGTVRRYPFSHFEFYRPEIREQVLADQIAFVDKALGRTSTGGNESAAGPR